jgi:hypothetical protein
MSALGRIYAQTIWHPDAIPEKDREYASPLKRVFLPLFDVIAVLAGWNAIHSGIPAIENSVPDAAANAVGYLFSFAALAALVGTAFPRLWRVEYIGKLGLFAILGVYLLALRVIGATDNGARDFVGCVVGMAMILPLLSLYLLGRRRRVERQIKALAKLTGGGAS